MTILAPPPTPIEDKNSYEWTKWFYDLYTRLAGGGLELDTYTVATLPDATNAEAKILYVSDETGGATLAFSDGTDWRRVQDRAVVS